MKKLLTLLLALILTVGVLTTAFAEKGSDVKIKSLETQEELIDYGMRVFPKHLHALLEVGDLSGLEEDYSLGEAFTVFNVVEDTNSSCFPVLKDGDIVAILEVVNDQGEHGSSLSISFANELEKVLSSSDLDNFVLLTDGVHLQVFDGNRSFEIFQLYDDGNDIEELSSHFTLPMGSLQDTPIQRDLNSELKINKGIVYDFSPTAVDGPTSYKTLNVRGVSQSGKTCWAATCAAIINYYKGLRLDDVEVSSYVHGSGCWNQGGNWEDIKKAYNHWRLYPSQTGRISFSRVKSNINSGDPMHLRLRASNGGHSLGLIGYEDWVGSAGGYNDRILILLEPNRGVHRSVTLNSSGEFNYKLGGGTYSWTKTIEF